MIKLMVGIILIAVGFFLIGLNVGAGHTQTVVCQLTVDSHGNGSYNNCVKH